MNHDHKVEIVAKGDSMKAIARFAFSCTLVFALCASASAATITYDLSYTNLAAGPSFGTGRVTIDGSVLTPSNFDFTNTLTNFIDSFSLTFLNFPSNGPITFRLSDLRAAFLQTDGSGNISDLNFWSYDRISLGTNTCPPCTMPYLAGVAPFTGTVTDPVHNNTTITFHIALTAVPEPTAFWLLLSCVGVAAMYGQRRKRS